MSDHKGTNTPARLAVERPSSIPNPQNWQRSAAQTGNIFGVPVSAKANRNRVQNNAAEYKSEPRQSLNPKSEGQGSVITVDTKDTQAKEESASVASMGGLTDSITTGEDGEDGVEGQPPSTAASADDESGAVMK